MTRRLLIVLLAASILVWIAAMPAPAAEESTLDNIQRTKTLRVGWAVVHPYIYRDPKTNEISGFSIDLMRDMAGALGDGVKPQLVEDSWGTLAAGLQANKFDIVPLLAVTLTRALAVGFSDPYTKHGLTLLAPKDAVAKTKSWQDFDKPGTKIGVTLGSNTDWYLTRAIKQAEIVRLKSVPENILAVTAGRTNAYASTTDSLQAIKKEQPQLELAAGKFGSSVTSFAVRRGDQEWLNWVNIFVSEMKRTGRIKELLDKYGMDHSFAAD
jgi:polar amino acid transport system substrate-binding protein